MNQVNDIFFWNDNLQTNSPPRHKPSHNLKGLDYPSRRVRKRPIREVVLTYFYESHPISVCYSHISGSADYQIYAYNIVSADL